jgi:hypothetical protein
MRVVYTEATSPLTTEIADTAQALSRLRSAVSKSMATKVDPRGCDIRLKHRLTGEVRLIKEDDATTL